MYGDSVDLSLENGFENTTLNKPSGDSEFVYTASYGETHWSDEETRVSNPDPQNTGNVYTYTASDSNEHKGVNSSAVERGIANPLYVPVDIGGDVVEEGLSYVRLDRNVDVSENPVKSQPRN